MLNKWHLALHNLKTNTNVLNTNTKYTARLDDLYVEKQLIEETFKTFIVEGGHTPFFKLPCHKHHHPPLSKMHWKRIWAVFWDQKCEAHNRSSQCVQSAPLFCCLRSQKQQHHCLGRRRQITRVVRLSQVVIVDTAQLGTVTNVSVVYVVC